MGALFFWNSLGLLFQTTYNCSVLLPILTTKLNIPPTPPDLVVRRRLLEQLNQGLHCRLTLVSAPAGFGKTTLISHWLASLGATSPTPVVWLSLDEADNDPSRFLTCLVTGLQRHAPEIGQTVQSLLQSNQRPSIETLMVLLINDLAGAATGLERIVWVFDDYHRIQNEAIHTTLTLLLENLPPGLHVIITTRTDPPFPLARLRGRQQVAEIRADDLRFTAEESAEFLNRTRDLNLQPQEVATLETRTEGWITGLQLAALALQSALYQEAAAKEAFIATYTGQDRYVVDYLLEEVLRRQPEPIQTFLLQSSILEQLSGSLCDAVVKPAALDAVELANSQQILEYLERHNLFIIPLDNERRWYRYQQLFGGFLRSRLRQTQPELVPELHLRAADWCQAQGAISKAIDHTLAAGAFETAAALIESASDLILRTHGEVTTYLHWLNILPEEIIRQHPRLLVNRVWAALFSGQWEDAETQLEQVEDATLPDEADMQALRGEILALRSELVLFQDDIDQALRLTEQAQAIIPEDNLRLRRSVAQIQGYIYRLNGQVGPAEETLQQSAELSRAVGDLTVQAFALSDLAEVQVMQGQLRRATATFRQVVALAADQNVWPFPPVCGAYIGLGDILFEQNELEAARQHLERGITLSQQGQLSGYTRRGYMILARIKQGQGQSEEAFGLVQQASEIAEQAKSGWMLAQVELTRLQLWLMAGEVKSAVAWAKRYEETRPETGFTPAYQYHQEERLLHRIRLAQGATDLAAIEQLYQRAEASGWHYETIAGLILHAIACEQANQPKRGLTSLQTALTLAQPEGYVRLFINEGAVMARLLRLALAQGAPADYVGKLQAAFMPTVNGLSTAAQPLIDPLTRRELEVLGLMAQGLSNREIAEQLIVAMGTVAKYTNNIFTKLSVKNRTQAIAQAKSLNLLT